MYSDGAVNPPCGDRWWFGGLSSKKPCGKGRYEYLNGEKFHGSMGPDGLRLRGKNCEPCGDVYDGEFVNDVYHGQGRLVRRQGRDSYEYVGEFQNGQFHGKGRAVYDDGGSYEGGWAEHERHGHGVCYWPNNSMYSGVWKMGEMVSKGGGGCTLVFADGRRYSGEEAIKMYDEWNDGKPEMAAGASTVSIIKLGCIRGAI